MSVEYNTETEHVLLFIDREYTELLMQHLSRYLKDNVPEHDHFIAADDEQVKIGLDKIRRTPPGDFTIATHFQIVYLADGESRFAKTESEA
jgi:hypothetical protein